MVNKIQKFTIDIRILCKDCKSFKHGQAKGQHLPLTAELRQVAAFNKTLEVQ